MEIIEVNEETVKDWRVLAKLLEKRCDIVTKKAENRNWLYIKNPHTLNTLGGIRLNKNSIGTFYFDTKLGYPINDDLFAVISQKKEKFISNRITVNNLRTLDKVCDLLNSLRANATIFDGQRK